MIEIVILSAHVASAKDQVSLFLSKVWMTTILEQKRFDYVTSSSVFQLSKPSKKVLIAYIISPFPLAYRLKQNNSNKKQRKYKMVLNVTMQGYYC